MKEDLIRLVSQNLEEDYETCKTIINKYIEVILTLCTLKGSCQSELGTLEIIKEELKITRQNDKIKKLLTEDMSEKEISEILLKIINDNESSK